VVSAIYIFIYDTFNSDKRLIMVYFYYQMHDDVSKVTAMQNMLYKKS